HVPVGPGQREEPRCPEGPAPHLQEVSPETMSPVPTGAPHGATSSRPRRPETLLGDNSSMKLLLITNVFPTPYQLIRGTFNLARARALAREHEARGVCPTSWVDEWMALRGGQGLLSAGRSADLDGIEVHYPRYYYPPKLFRRHYGRFLWFSTRPTIRRLMGSY